MIKLPLEIKSQRRDPQVEGLDEEVHSGKEEG
jgi:hypothetical protein